MVFEKIDWFISKNDSKKYSKLKTIGKGAFSNVYLVKEQTSERELVFIF
jgi:hypothetical protein